jgi:hypothetical protein
MFKLFMELKLDHQLVFPDISVTWTTLLDILATENPSTQIHPRSLAPSTGM